MHAQLSVEAMFKSIMGCREIVESNQPVIINRSSSQTAANLIAALEGIERQQAKPNPENIDQLKLQVIRGLYKLSRTIKMPFVLPQNLRKDDFYFTLEDANKAPGSPH